MPTTGYELASAYISLVVSGRDVYRQVEREAADAGQRSGRAYTSRAERSLGGIGRVFGRVFNRSEGDARTAGQRAGAAYGRAMTGAMSGIGSKLLAGVAVAGGVAAIGGSLKESIDLASDSAEAGSKIMQIFGKEGATALEAYAARGAKALGQTRLQVLDAAGVFGTFGKSAGLQGPALADFSSRLVGLSTDLASFHNTSPQEAVEAIGAALRGESEPMRRYGVLLDDATLRQEAMRQGLVKTTKEALTPAQKVLAAQAVIMRQTTDAQGDFARTSGGLANQQRIFAAQVQDSKAKLGGMFLPVATRTFSFLNNVGVPALAGVSRFFRGLATQYGPPAVRFFRDAVTHARPLVTNIFGRVVSVGGHAGAVLGRIASQYGPPLLTFFRGLAQRAQPVVAALGSRFLALGREAGPALAMVARSLRPVVAGVAPLVRSLASGLVPVFGKVAGVIASLLRGMPSLTSVVRPLTDVFGFLGRHMSVLLSVGAGVLAMWGAYRIATLASTAVTLFYNGVIFACATVMNIANFATKAWAAGQAILNAVMSANPIGLVVLAVIGLVAAFVVAYKTSGRFREFVQRAWAGIKDAASATVSWFKNTAWPAIKAVWDGIASGAMWLWREGIMPAWRGIQAGAAVVVGWFRDYVVPVIGTVWSLLVAGAKLWWSGVQAYFGLVWGVAKSVFGWFLDVGWPLIRLAFQLVRAAVALLWHGAVKPVFTFVWDLAKSVFGWFVATGWPLLQRAFSLISAVIRTAWTTVIKPVFTFVWDLARSVFGWIMDTGWPLLKRAFSLIGSVISTTWNSVIKPVFGWIKTGVHLVYVGFNTAKDKLVAAWNLVVNGVRNVWGNEQAGTGVAGIFGKMKAGVGLVKKGFETAKNGIKTAWDKLKSVLSTPIKAAINIVNDPFISGINSLLDKVGAGSMKITPLSVQGLAGGGYIPGPWRGPTADNVLGVSARGVPFVRVNPREFITRVAAADRMRREFPGWLEHINAHGRPPGFAAGGTLPGLWDGGDVWDTTKRIGGRIVKKATDVLDVGRDIAQFFTDPEAALRKLADSALRGLGDGLFGRLIGAAARSGLGSLARKILGVFGGSDGGGISGVVGAGSTGLVDTSRPAMSSSLIAAIIRAVIPGTSMSSGYRPGAITAAGTVSMHALNRAADIVPPSMATFWKIRKMFPSATQLIYTPAGAAQLLNGRPFVYGEPARSMHYDHIHVAMHGGGDVATPLLFDQGGYLPKGLSMVMNRTGAPEPLRRVRDDGTDESRPRVVVNVHNPVAEPTSRTIQTTAAHILAGA